MRLCFLGPYSCIHLQRWVRWFLASGRYEIHICSADGEPEENCFWHPLLPPRFPKILSYIQNVYKLKNILKEIKPDILHCHFLSGYGYLGAACGFHPYILTVWGSDVYMHPHQSPLHNWLARYGLRKADLITGDAYDILEAIKKLEPNSGLSDIIQWGVELDDFVADDNLSLRQKLNWEDKLILISVRQFEPLYNIPRILQAIYNLQTQFPNLVGLFLGGGSLQGELENIAKKLDISDKVKIIGKVPRKELIGYLQIADVFVSIPNSDATSVALLEAMSTKKAIIVNDLSANKEWIKEDFNGLIISLNSQNTQNTLEEAIADLLLNPSKRQLFGEHNRKIVEERADNEINMKKMEDYYNRLVVKSFCNILG